MEHAEILKAIEQEVSARFTNAPNGELPYHNLNHTQNVVKYANEIAAQYQLSEEDIFVLNVAAWFHDVAYVSTDINTLLHHEEEGAAMAVKFLSERDIASEICEKVKGCILATKINVEPQNLLQQIICDSDLFHLGTKEFKVRDSLLLQEMRLNPNIKISKKEWRKKTLAFLENCRFYTSYCQQFLSERLQKNIAQLKEKIMEEENTPTDEKPKEKKKKDKKTSNRPDKGIETMFRISSGNHQRLSDMADNKAHIMISTTSIITSVLLSVLLSKLDNNPQLIVPTILLLSVCIVTMVFSILATRPGLSSGKFTQSDLENKKTNLLFFGNFYKMDFETYANGVEKMMDDRSFLYGTLTRDLHSQGVVLGRKYKLLRIAYNTFMFGIVASVVSFIIATLIYL